MNTNQTSKWCVDAVLFSVFVVAFLLDLTGPELHQWIGVIAGALAGYHLLTHWNWVTAVTRRFLGKTPARARLYYLLDRSILIGFFVISLTGLVISSWLDLALTNATAWVEVHILASIATLIVTVIKIGLHWRWIVAVAKKALSEPAAPQHKPETGLTAAGAQTMSRREFFGVMGVVSFAAFFALTNAVDGLQATESPQASSDSPAQVSSLNTANLASSNGACSVRCGRGCSYPGHCRRYTDTNGNNRCDFGECV